MEKQRDTQIEMAIGRLTNDPMTLMPIVVLVEKDGSRRLPIWIGKFESDAIHLRLEEVEPPRPMTHDLLKAVIDDLGGVVERVVVCDLKDNTFFATIDIRSPQGTITVDSRPSDAIALATRTGARIFAEESVIQSAHGDAGQSVSVDVGRLVEWLNNLDDEDLGKYKM
jgi:bifunctional DNase/RNase